VSESNSEVISGFPHHLSAKTTSDLFLSSVRVKISPDLQACFMRIGDVSVILAASVLRQKVPTAATFSNAKNRFFVLQGRRNHVYERQYFLNYTRHQSKLSTTLCIPHNEVSSIELTLAVFFI
jgi:hypothetical protein